MSRFPSIKRHIDQWEAQRQERDEARRRDEWVREVSRRIAAQYAPSLERIALAKRMRTLAGNLRAAAGLHAAYRLGRVGLFVIRDDGKVHGWEPNLDGRAAPGWER